MTLNKFEQMSDERAYLDSLILHGLKLGLHNIEALMACVPPPWQSYPVIHVGGTNGKGSVVAFLGAILGAAGYRTGRFSSPHLLDVTERFLVYNCPMDDHALHENIAFFRRAATNTSFTPTYFEMNTAIAFRWFAQQKVDMALIEVGMGGRFDATNIVSPQLSAITSIDLDHTQYLGDTLEAIAFEKAGILKPGTPAVIGVMDEAPRHVIEEQAQMQSVRLYHPGKDYQVEFSGDVWQPRITYTGPGLTLSNASLGLCGAHQASNAAIAITLALLLRSDFPRITETAIRTGLKNARWPGRLERVLDQPPVIMDVAHNPAGCRTVAEAVKHCVTIFSVSADKNASAMLDILRPISEPLILTEYEGGRCLSLEELVAVAAGHPHLAIPHLSEALDQGMRLASPEKPLLVTGSIYAAGEARSILVERYGAAPVVYQPF